MDEWGRLPNHYKQNLLHGGEWMHDHVWRPALRLPSRLLHWAAPTSTAKLNMSVLVGGIGAVLIALEFSADVTKGSPGTVGALLMFTAFVISNRAGAQQESEARAADLLEWHQSAQRFRRAMGRIWDRLKGPAYGLFTMEVPTVWTFEQLVDRAGWPDEPGETASDLLSYLRECLLPPGEGTMFSDYDAPTFRRFMGANLPGKSEVAREFEEVKYVLELWPLAIRSGGSRADAMRKVILDLEKNHYRSIRLVRFLAVAHTEYVGITDNPDYEFVDKVRAVMEGRE